MKKAFLLRPFPNGANEISAFRNESIIAIGFPKVEDLHGKSLQEIKNQLSSTPNDLSGFMLGNALASINTFLNEIQSGDICVLPDGDDIYFCEVNSDYQYDSKKIAVGYPHLREIKFLSQTSRNRLSKEFRKALKMNRIAYPLTQHIEEITALIKGVSIPTTQMIEVNYPLRPGLNISFKIPADISKTEAERLSTHLSSLYFQE